jgi:hypothetical protein
VGALYQDQPLIAERVRHPLRDQAAAAVRKFAVVMNRVAVTDRPHQPQLPAETRMPTVVDFHGPLVAGSM